MTPRHRTWVKDEKEKAITLNEQYQIQRDNLEQWEDQRDAWEEAAEGNAEVLAWQLAKEAVQDWEAGDKTSEKPPAAGSPPNLPGAPHPGPKPQVMAKPLLPPELPTKVGRRFKSGSKS